MYRVSRTQSNNGEIYYQGKPLTKDTFQKILQSYVSEKIGIHFEACSGAENLQSSDSSRLTSVSGAGFGGTFLRDFVQDIDHTATPPKDFHSQKFHPPHN